ncbi:hypothetical protein [Microbacterium sp. T32]|uniref:hypothetical protein n=1 Tax=Microbacterium sp. T32 TaxID=1776083 RepID=UPI0012E92AB2|nr:hypothetical protein [Microbacterium sp. T32]
MNIDVVKALPFLAAALAQILSALVRRLSGHITSAHFEAAEAAEAVPPFEAHISPHLRPKRLARDLIPDGYKADAIARVNSKNAEGANALTGSITLLSAVLGSGLVVESVWYSILVFLSVGVGLAFAVALWTRSSSDYVDSRWLGISRSAVILAGLNVCAALGIVCVGALLGTSPAPAVPGVP